MKRGLKILFITVLLLWISCASVEEVPPEPDWLLIPPSDTRDQLYFVGQGRNDAGNERAAVEFAVREIVALITEFYNLLDSQLSIPEIPLYLDQLEKSKVRIILKSWEERVLQSDSAEMDITDNSDLLSIEVVDYYTRFERVNGEETVEAFLLVKVSTNILLNEKSEIDLLYNRMISEALALERQGAAQEEAGEIIDAFDSYIHAAEEFRKAAFGTDEDVTRNLDSAFTLLNQISLESSSANFRWIGTDNGDQTVVFSLSAGNARINDLEQRLPLILRETISVRPEETRSSQFYADQNGNVVYPVSSPGYPVSGTVSVQLDLNSYYTRLEALGITAEPYLDQITSIAQKSAISVHYAFESVAAEIPTLVILIELGAAGNPTGNSDSAEGLESILQEEGYDLKVLYPDTEISRLDDIGLIRYAEEIGGTRYKRIILGHMSISDFDDTNEYYAVTVSGTLKVFQFNGRNLLYQDSLVTNARGRSLSRAMATAFKNAGRAFARELLIKLP